MHVLRAIALVLAAIGVVLVVVALVRRGASGRAGLPLRIGLGALAGFVVIALSLTYAQREVCSVLGGSWRARGEACWDEFGGNGDNQRDNGADLWPWTEGFAGGNWFEERQADFRGESES
jgi:hypothetical protein